MIIKRNFDLTEKTLYDATVPEKYTQKPLCVLTPEGQRLLKPSKHLANHRVRLVTYRVLNAGNKGNNECQLRTINLKIIVRILKLLIYCNQILDSFEKTKQKECHTIKHMFYSQNLNLDDVTETYPIQQI
jgi:hypothetical protein